MICWTPASSASLPAECVQMVISLALAFAAARAASPQPPTVARLAMASVAASARVTARFLAVRLVADVRLMVWGMMLLLLFLFFLEW